MSNDDLKNSNQNIHTLVDNGDFDLIKNFIFYDVNLIDAIDEVNGKTPLIICAHKKSHFEIAKFLLDCGCDVNIQSNFKWNNWSALMTACYYGNTSIVEALVNANAHLDLVDVAGNTALQLALENGHVECIQIILNEKENNDIGKRLKLEKDLQDSVLIDNDFDLVQRRLSGLNKDHIKQIINSTTSGSHTLLYKACRNGNPDIVRLLLDNGAIARPHYYTKYSPLYIACHMGKFEIAKMILERFPHLIQVPTIENFLPFHAVCSQGHLNILKLLLDQKQPLNIHSMLEEDCDLDFQKVYANDQGQKYLNSFDLNSLDMNGQSGLHLAVLGNHLEICLYLLEYTIKQLSPRELNDYELKRINKLKAISKSRTSSSVSQKSKAYSDEDGYSLFDHLKNVFLDVKAYDPYVINYIAPEHENEEETLNFGYPYDNLVSTEAANEEIIKTDQQLEKQEKEPIKEKEIYFHPINMNGYSKFGNTCLHEAIKRANIDLVKLLIDHGANVNASVYDINLNQAQETITNSSMPVVSNCLCEAVKGKDELIFLLLLNKFNYDEFSFNLVYQLCIELWKQDQEAILKKQTDPKLSNDLFNLKKIISYLLRFKVVVDYEYKLNLKNMLKHASPLYSAMNVENGLIFNWNSLEPKLNVIYESWLLESSKHFKQSLKSSRSFTVKKVTEQLMFKKSMSSEKLMDKLAVHEQDKPLDTHFKRSSYSLKRLHFFVITRLDFSNNNLEHVPFAIFQIESLKFLKMSSNKLKTLPTRHNHLDDVNRKFFKTKNAGNLHWTCHNLEELDLDKNELNVLPFQVFQLKSLKFLNISHNSITQVPEEIWNSPMLIELNASFNKIVNLPLFSKRSIEQNCYQTDMETADNSLFNSIIKRNPQQKNRSRKAEPSTLLIGETSTNYDSLVPISNEIVQDHPLNEMGDSNQEKIESNELIQSKKINRQIQISYEEKIVEKANFWQRHSVVSSQLDPNTFEESFEDEITKDVDSFQAKFNRTRAVEGKLKRESNLKELNLSHNKISKIPECLSCLAPKLIKLNLSYNHLETMGAICDLPKSLKFLDLSNNSIKFSMRLLNDKLLRLMISYFELFSSGAVVETDYLNLLGEFTNQSRVLLENEFCYKSLIENLLENVSSQTGVNQCARERASELKPPVIQKTLNADSNDPTNKPNSLRKNLSNRFRKKSPIQSQGIVPVSVTSKITNNINNFSANRRRARSQSRSHRNAITLSKNIPGNQVTQIPFDLFLLNLKNMNSLSAVNYSSEFKDPEVEKLRKEISNLELERKEKKILNNMNIQLFMEHMCPHKRHIKLDNLKSLNLSHNKLKRSKLMFDLVSVFQNDFKPTPSPSSQNLSSLLLADAARQPSLRIEQKILSHISQELFTNDTKAEHNSQSSDSDYSYSEEELSDQDELKYNSKIRSSKSRLKQKLGVDKLPFKSSLYVNNKEERSKMIAKLMYPNLTHLDMSFNFLRHLTYKFMYLENLSYLNVSSNDQLVRVSPRLGLLNKLWNFDFKNCDNLKYPSNLDNLIKQQTKTVDILSYLKSIMEQSKPYARVKLMFVGVQAIGKTSLLNKLKEEGEYFLNDIKDLELSEVKLESILKAGLRRLDKLGTTPSHALNRQSWSERTQQNNSASPSSSKNISTVGIDINEWIYDKSKHKPLLSPNQNILQLQQQSIYLYQIDYLNNKTLGPVTFKTWDFGGQKEYYSTHQYFISKRALYLVCWKLSEEEKGIVEIQNWLVNIQTRAPGSPVIIVGTHQDQLAKLKNYKEISSYLQRIIYERFVRPTGENETASPYPPIMASIEISSRTGYNIKMLAKVIYETASQMKAPGFKDQSLLEQKVPHTYLALEECIACITKKLKMKSLNPVLDKNNYLKEIREAIEQIYPSKGQENIQSRNILIRFRDDAEILQATQFLHENGILIHYNDSALRDLFFLDPQWLCDVLASVITIREINPFATKGIMKINDLQILFKGLRFNETEEIMKFIVDLLGKFELALTWDNENLLIPSLLPSEAMLQFTKNSIKTEILSKEKALSKLFDTFSSENPHIISNLYQRRYSSQNQISSSASYISFFSELNENLESNQSNTKLANSHSQIIMNKKVEEAFFCEALNSTSASEREKQPFIRYEDSTVRLYCLSYLPTGFFSRLITRILGDNLLKNCLNELIDIDYSYMKDSNQNIIENNTELLSNLIDFVCQKAEWKCWQTGIELKYLGFTLMSIKEIIFDPFSNNQIDQNLKTNLENDIYYVNPVLYKDCENELQLKASNRKCSFVECYCSFKNFAVYKKSQEAEFDSKQRNSQSDEANPRNDPIFKILCNKKVSIKLFSLIIEIIDSLLEDWYPDLGTKFMQDSKGEYLVTRLSPCKECLIAAEKNLESVSRKSSTSSTRSDSELHNYEKIKKELADITQTDMNDPLESIANRQTQSMTILENHLKNADFIFSFMIDDVCYSVLKNSNLNCPKHGEQTAQVIAPDLAFEDIEDSLLISHKVLKIEGLLGRGSFGYVFSGCLNLKNTATDSDRFTAKSLKFENFNKVKVAVKILETLDNTQINQTDNKEINFNQYNFDMSSLGESKMLKQFNSKLADYWNHRKSIQMAAKAYTVARQEVAILGELKHENIVGMLGLSVKPLAIILELAPLGNLKEILEQYKKSICKVSPFIIQQVAIQISSALVYLHSNRIIYRDLKCDNVLVWKFPMPQDNLVKQNTAHLSNIQLNSMNSAPNKFFNINSVCLKLADYSISRSVLPTGTKGFAGTEGFMAPEIVRFNGEETYSEKVDCFSFGMVLYELISLKLPFEGHEQIKDIIFNDVRPLIKINETFYPTLMLDLMCLCWLDSPCERPSAQEINNYSKSYEFSHLLDVTILQDYEDPPLVITCINREEESIDNLEVEAIQKIKAEKLSPTQKSRTFSNDSDDDDYFIHDEEFEEEDVIDMWVVRNSQNEGSSQIEILSYEYNLNCTNKRVINVCPGKIEMLCNYNENQVWCIDSLKCLYIYCANTKRKLNQYLLDANLTSPIVSMFPLENLRRILLCTSNGSLLLINVEAAHELSLSNNSVDVCLTDHELGYVLIEIPIKINTCLILPSRYEKSYDLWIGSERSEIFCFSLKTMKLTGSYMHTSSHHFVTNSILSNNIESHLNNKIQMPQINKSTPLDVTILKTNPNDTFFLWSYVYPGSTVYLWNHVSKKIMSAYNCLKAFDDLNFKPISPIRNFKIVDISFMNGILYCGINSGIVLALKRLTLTPLFMFNAHMHQLYNICPLTFETKIISYNQFNNQSSNLEQEANSERNITKNVKKTSHSLVSLGRAVAPIHEDIYLSSTTYRDRVDALKKYANCLILCSWNCTES